MGQDYKEGLLKKLQGSAEDETRVMEFFTFKLQAARSIASKNGYHMTAIW